MPIVVQKYGGSSLADIEKVQAVAAKVAEKKRAGYDVVVVVSAMGDTTDELLSMAREISTTPSRRELDMLLSVGERISMTLLSMAIHDHDLHAISLTGSQCGIITTDSHSNARIMDVRPFRVQDELAKGNIVIIAGYQGTSYRREVTTLGRGGSDTTAVALAAALGAEACEIYSDVDGVYSADPRVVLEAKQLAELSHEEMMEMARAGAKVLNEQAVEFARQAGIALYARSTHARESIGTIVRPDGFDERARRVEQGRPAVAVSHIARGLWIRAVASAEAVAELVAEVPLTALDWNEGRLSAFIPLDDLHDEESFVDAILAAGDDASVEHAALVSAIGQGIGSRLRWPRAARAALVTNGITPQHAFISHTRLSWVIDEEQVGPAARLVHRVLVAE